MMERNKAATAPSLSVVRNPKKTIILYDLEGRLEETLRRYKHRDYDIEYVTSEPDLEKFKLNIGLNKDAPIIIRSPDVSIGRHYEILEFLRVHTSKTPGARALIVYNSELGYRSNLSVNVHETHEKELEENPDVYMNFLLSPGGL